MPGKYCALPACSNRHGRSSDCDKKKVVYHTFPKDMQLRKQWIDVCRAAGTCKPDSYFICSDHFRSSDYARKSGGKRRALRNEALPSQNLGGSKTAARSSVKEIRSLKRFRALDAVRNKPPVDQVIADNTAAQVTPHRTRSDEDKVCQRCSHLQEHIETLKLKNSRLMKRISVLEKEILELIN